MKLLLNTDILIDLLTKRAPFYEDAKKLCIAAYFGDVELWASVQSYVDADYALRSLVPDRALRDAMLGSLEFISPCGSRAIDLRGALESSNPNLDAYIVAKGAQSVAADYVITRDLQGFAGFRVPAISSQDVIAMLAETGFNYDEVGL